MSKILPLDAHLFMFIGFFLFYMSRAAAAKSLQSCPTVCDPMDCSLPGFSVHGIFPGKSIGVGCHCLLHVQGYQHTKTEAVITYFRGNSLDLMHSLSVEIHLTWWSPQNKVVQAIWNFNLLGRRRCSI